MVIYLYNNNENNNENTQNIDNTNAQDSGADGGGGGLSGGAIGGIVTACTIISTILAAMGVWYARVQARRKKAKANVEDKNTSQSSAPSSPYVATQGHAHPVSPPPPCELPWNEAYPKRAQAGYSSQV